MRVRAKWPIKHDGVTYEAGQVLEVTPEQARALAKSGSIERADEEGEAKDEGSSK